VKGAATAVSRRFHGGWIAVVPPFFIDPLSCMGKNVFKFTKPLDPLCGEVPICFGLGPDQDCGMTMSAVVHAACWGRFGLAEGQTGRWTIGPMTLWVKRLSQEWRLAFERVDDPELALVEAALPCKTEEVEAAEARLAFERFLMRDTTAVLHLSPAAADRSVVVRPSTPFHLLPRQETTIFVSSPLWVKIEVNEEKKMLKEIPILRPSDTWFGPSTREGELCYSGQTQARLIEDEISFRPHRAITPVTISNEARTVLNVEKINLPVTYLSLYGTAGGALWTDSVQVKLAETPLMATVTIQPGPPPQAQEPALTLPPRLTAGRGALTRAMSSLFA